MHQIARKFPQYAVAGGKGRLPLYLYEPGDPWSAKEVLYFTLSEREYRRRLKRERDDDEA